MNLRGAKLKIAPGTQVSTEGSTEERDRGRWIASNEMSGGKSETELLRLMQARRRGRAACFWNR